MDKIPDGDMQIAVGAVSKSAAARGVSRAVIEAVLRGAEYVGWLHDPREAAKLRDELAALRTKESTAWHTGYAAGYDQGRAALDAVTGEGRA